MLDFVVLTGFLGSGKTTLLRDYLALPEAAGTAVIVNEVGEIGLDGAILAESSGGLRMAMLANGCVCCMLGSDLATTVEQLVASRDARLRRIVLETSGLSKPGPILRGLASLAALRMRVSVVATFDCVRGADVAGFEEAAAQWAGAQALVLTRRDMASAAQRAAARAMARGVNPLADIVDCDDRRDCVLAAFAPRPPARLVPQDDAGVPHPRISVMLVRWTAASAWDDVAAWLDNLAGLLGERLLRIKGVVADPAQCRSSARHPPARHPRESGDPCRLGPRFRGDDGWGGDDARGPKLLVQSVGTMFSAPRPFAGAVDAPFLVVIARDASPDELARVAPALPVVISRLGARDPFARAPTPPLRAT